MAQTCRQCSRTNPDTASYCHFDGSLLEHHVYATTILPAGLAPFPSAFVFASGEECRNFNDLARACQANWDATLDLLRQGLLERFFAGVGRMDLARAAQEAARTPDPDQGLDQLLARLPGQGLDHPRLRVPVQSFDFGTLKVGEDRRLELTVANDGRRLLVGAVSSTCPWLALGEPPGGARKVFQCRTSLTLAVLACGQQLRAGPRPWEAELLVETNGGDATVVVRGAVPVRPFAGGVLAGAGSPREIAEKARAAPREAAALFERGAVAHWYRLNGWTYPVPGPPARGVGAVQQFFRALGLPDTFGPLTAVAARNGPVAAVPVSPARSPTPTPASPSPARPSVPVPPAGGRPGTRPWLLVAAGLLSAALLAMLLLILLPAGSRDSRLPGATAPSTSKADMQPHR